MIMANDESFIKRCRMFRDWGRIGDNSEAMANRFTSSVDGIPYDGAISARSRRYLGAISAVSRRYLGGISAVSDRLVPLVLEHFDGDSRELLDVRQELSPERLGVGGERLQRAKSRHK